MSLLKLSVDTVADALLEADIVGHVKQILSAHDLSLLKLSVDTVADALLEADVVGHVKQILSAHDAVVGLLHNALMLVKSLCMIGQCSS